MSGSTPATLRGGALRAKQLGALPPHGKLTAAKRRALRILQAADPAPVALERRMVRPRTLDALEGDRLAQREGDGWVITLLGALAIARYRPHRRPA